MTNSLIMPKIYCCLNMFFKVTHLIVNLHLYDMSLKLDLISLRIGYCYLCLIIPQIHYCLNTVLKVTLKHVLQGYTAYCISYNYKISLKVVTVNLMLHRKGNCKYNIDNNQA